MALKLGELMVDIGADTSDLKRAEKEVKTSANNMNDGFNKLDKTITNVFKAALGGVTVSAIAAYTKQMMSAIDATAKFADRIGIGVEELQRLQFVAEQTGASVGTLNMGLQRMTRRVAEAANGTGEAVAALDELGLSAQWLNQQSPDEQFKAIADAMNDVNSQSDKVRLAFKLFDSEGVALINTMKGGSEAIMDIATSADIATKEAVRHFEWFNDRMNELSKSTSAAWAQFTSSFIASWRKVSDDMSVEQLDREIQQLTDQMYNLRDAVEADPDSFLSKARLSTLAAWRVELDELIAKRDQLVKDEPVEMSVVATRVPPEVPMEVIFSYEQYADAMREASMVSEELESKTQTMDQAYSAMALSLDNLSGSFGGTETAAGKAVSALSNAARSIVAISQAQAAAMALADPTAITTPQKLLNYATIISSFATITGMLTQGGRQFGGSVSPMMATPINEAGVPEMLSMGGKQYLLPTGQGGTVTPLSGGGAASGGGGSMSVTQNITVSGTGDKDLIMAMENAANQGAQKAQAEYVRQMSQKNGTMYKATQQNYGSGKTTGRAQ